MKLSILKTLFPKIVKKTNNYNVNNKIDKILNDYLDKTEKVKRKDSLHKSLNDWNNIKNDQHIIDLNNWLSNLKVDRYLMNFLNNGYHSIELLLMQMETENPLTTQILRDEIGIDKIGYRSRILNKLKEEGRSLNNKLKTSVLVVNNRGDDKNCECIIF